MLVVEQASYGLYLDEEMREMVFHYDYAREPENNYPVAHVQVAGTSAALRELSTRCGREMTLEDLHFPVGGRRFRTSLEDVVEFLIVEKVVPAREGWEEVIRRERIRFREIQTAAAARRFPEAAAEGLRRQGWRVEPPSR